MIVLCNHAPRASCEGEAHPFSMVSRTLRKEGTPTASKLVLYGNHTPRAEMDTGPSEINAHFINWPHVARAAPGPPNSMLVCSVGPHLLQKWAFISHRCARGSMVKRATLNLRGAGEVRYRFNIETGVYVARTGS